MMGALLGPPLLFLLLFVASRIGAARIESRYPPIGQIVDVADGPIHLVDRGPRHGLALVLIHGASGNLRDLDTPLGSLLAERRRVVVVDRPGQGWSGRAPGPEASRPEHQARAINAALRAIGVAEVVLVGHSLGASVALAMALEAPERVRGIVLMTPATHPWSGNYISFHNHVAAMPIVGRLLAEIGPVPIGTLVMEPVVGGVFRPDPAPEGYAERAGIPLVLRPASFRANARDVVALSDNLARLQPRYGEIRAPTLVMVGTHDPIVANELHARGLLRDIPSARLVSLPTGHMPHWAAPNAVIAEIESFVTSLR